MKQPSDELYQLITRMSDDEKQYFRKFCLILKQVNHISTTSLLHLFEVMCQLNTYDETKLKRKLSGTIKDSSFKTCKSVLKEYLRQGLDAYHSSQNSPPNYRHHINHA